MPSVSIANSIEQIVTVSLKQPGGYPIEEYQLRPGESLPNDDFPDSVPDTNLTPYTRELARKGYIQIIPVAQIVSVEFENATQNAARGAGSQNIGVKLVTADGEVLEETTTVDVFDDSTGSGLAGTDYTYTPNPKTVTFNPGDANGLVKDVTLVPAEVASAFAEMDYSVEPDTPDFLHPNLTHQLTSAQMDVVSGVYITTANGELTGYVKNSVLDLNGFKMVYAEAVGLTHSTSLGHCRIGLADSATPGKAAIVGGIDSTFTGYLITFGSGSTAFIDRVVAGVPTSLGSIGASPYAGQTFRFAAYVAPARTTLRLFKNSVQLGSDIIDGTGSRISNFRTATFCIRRDFTVFNASVTKLRAGSL